ncbi:hypothetical protein Metfor_1929 [Methanoregula formicica SMSP]|uniref:Uncharacterized protein n=1 Tax=Methanoregula formicica (strain DSM 22288 / NBRC 105244 / SMSP) TaxID=593750 RepID=L0HDY7_METFS|nr:hypothetical protein Metfor_1929 [Methanoregula formicica SMSP]
MQFLWCGIHLSSEERQQDPFECPALLPCATIECALFREEAPLCVHLVREGPGKGCRNLSGKKLMHFLHTRKQRSMNIRRHPGHGREKKKNYRIFAAAVTAICRSISKSVSFPSVWNCSYTSSFTKAITYIRVLSLRSEAFVERL